MTITHMPTGIRWAESGSGIGTMRLRDKGLAIVKRAVERRPFFLLKSPTGGFFQEDGWGIYDVPTADQGMQFESQEEALRMAPEGYEPVSYIQFLPAGESALKCSG
jgi:hypothetical protein